MGNHFHLLLETPEPNLSDGMHWLIGVYTQRFNKRHKRVGHVFRGRFNARVMQVETYFLQVARYVVLNPVYDGFVGKPGDWQWSSYRATMGLAKVPPFLTTARILESFSKTLESARKRYKEFIEAGIKDRSIVEYIRSQRILGNDAFVESLLKSFDAKQVPVDLKMKKERIERPSLQEIFHGIDLSDKRSRDRKTCEAHHSHRHSQRQIGEFLGINHAHISRIVKKSQQSTVDPFHKRTG